MIKNRLTLLIHTCDKFSDLWDAHILLLNKNWKDRCIDTILLTDNPTDKTYKNIRIISAGIGTEITQRIEYVLNEIKTEYVLVTLDDYFLMNKVSSNSIETLINTMDNLKLDYLRLFKDPNSFEKILGYTKLYKISLDKNYQVNLYQGIWRKDFIQKTIKKPLNPWKYEVSLTDIAIKENARCALSKGKEFEILDVVRKGKLLHKSHKYLMKYNLYEGSREIISYKEELKLFIFRIGKKILPKKIAKLLKKLLIKSGITFYSNSI